MIDTAKAYLERVLEALGPQIDAGTPLVVLEPSCASVFRDELAIYFPTGTLAPSGCEAKHFSLANFWSAKRRVNQPPQLARKVLLHGHCHHKAVLKFSDQESLLRKMGVELESLDSGCCGMAGAFGFEAAKYDISQLIGERVLLPAVRRAAPDTLILSDGFSCREQIRQATGRQAMHMAEAIALAHG